MKDIWNRFTDFAGLTIFHPQFIMLRLTHQAVIEAKRRAKGKLVDIGCGRMPYRRELASLVDNYIGVDHPQVSKLYSPKQKPDVFADAKKLPFQNNTFDIALMLQVTEYLDNIEETFKEAARVLKRGGLLILSSPFLYSIHDVSYDKNRYTDIALRHFLKNAGFRVVKIEVQGGFLEFWIQSLNVFLLKRIQDIICSSKSVLSIIYLVALVVITPIVVIGSNILVLILSQVSLVFSHYPNYFPLNFLIVAKKKAAMVL